jgi:prepilin-type N-terminal cleavage/methylation domain-containing protein
MTGRGFTLIEVLIATAVGVMILATLTAAFVGARRAAARSEALTKLHLEAALVDRLIQEEIEVMHPCALMRLRAARPVAGGSDDSLTWVYATVLPNPDPSAGLGQVYANDLAWARWQWRANGVDGKPTLYHSRSSPVMAGRMRNNATDRLTYDLVEFPTLRRDRRAELDANDGRGYWGLDKLPAATFYDTTSGRTLFGLPGDDRDLQARAVPLAINIEDLQVSWVDRDGWSVLASAAGLSLTKDDGTAVSGAGSPGSDPYWSRRGLWLQNATAPYVTGTIDQIALDGMWTDAREWKLGSTATLPAPSGTGAAAYPASDARSANGRRPALIRVSFVLTDDPRPTGQRDGDARWIRQRFSFSHATAATFTRPLP